MFSPKIIASLILIILQPVNYYSNIDHFFRFRIQESKDKGETYKNVPTSNLRGLHFTEDEIKIWRERALKGPYLKAGDVSENSPGDWERITRNAKAFLENPQKEIWFGDTVENGCVQKNSAEPLHNAIRLKDAAFVFLVNREKIYGLLVKRTLLHQAGIPTTDFSNKKRWCDNVLHDIPPGFLIAEWLVRLLYAYDYTKDIFSDNEKKIMDDWFKNCAYFFKRNLEADFNRVFKNRTMGDFRLSTYGKGAGVDKIAAISFVNGWKIPHLAKRYNNRSGSIAKYVGLAGIFLKDKSLIATSKDFVKEWLMFSVFPDGVIGEYERWKEDFPDLGWGYASLMLGIITDIADAMARHGDQELYQFQTSKGAFGTEGGNKTILLTVKKLISFLDPQYTVLVPVSKLKTTSLTYANIDGVVEEKNWYTVSDTWFAKCNIYYQDDYLKENYLRKYKGRIPYPPSSKTATMGPHQPWSGTWATYPGVLFMYGQNEGKVWPYPKKEF